MKRPVFNTPGEVQVQLGSRIRRLRLNRNLDQRHVAAKAGISDRTLRDLELGKGSTLITLISVLKALDALDRLDAIAPEPSVSPMAMLARGHEPRRASRPRKKTGFSAH